MHLQAFVKTVVVEVNKKNEKFHQIFLTIVKEVMHQKRKRLDVWTPSKRTLAEHQGFKETILDFYQRRDGHDQVYCMVLNRSYPRNQVRATHIWKASTFGDGLTEFGLKKEDVSSPQNGLLLAEGIEQAFNNKEVCFVWNPLQQHLQLLVLNPDLMNQCVFPSRSKTFRDIHNSRLHHPPGKLPFRRLISWHASRSYQYARNRNWIDDEAFEQFNDFSDLSENASNPEFLDEELDSID